MRYRLKEVPRAPISKSNCQHYWLIEGAGGPTSRGVCKFCGVEREFSNSWPGFTYAVRNTRVAQLPELAEIEPEKEAEDSELEESSAHL